MDINLLYSRHQISLIRASSATSLQGRSFHETLAQGFARRIAQFRQDLTVRDVAVCGVGGGR